MADVHEALNRCGFEFLDEWRTILTGSEFGAGDNIGER